MPRKDISTDWKEGRYFDLWVFPHTMTGVTGGFANVFFGLSVPVVFGVGVVLMIIWEVAEVYAGITESWQNQALDVVVGLIGVSLALAIASRLEHQGRVTAFLVALAITAVSSTFGWIASRRKKRRARKAAGATARH